MGVGSRVQRFLKYQKVLSRQRHVSFNAPWRVLVILVSALLLYYAWSVLHLHYTGTSIPLGMGTIGDLLFNWFFYGMVIGAALFAFLFEGEYVLGVWKLASSVERELERDAERLLGVKGAGPGAGKAGGRAFAGRARGRR